ncbi:MAG: 6-bladed beta-propeller [Bacteroidetes bacterium]|nr:6-bladed beta-propeller [Bacteroidota bacterium]
MDFISLSNIFFTIRRKYADILFLSLFLVGCHNGQTRYEDSPTIDRLLMSAPHFVVNTDTESEIWTAARKLGLPSDSLFLASPSDMISIGDSIYISDELSSHFFSIGNNGYLNRKIGRPGKGPGEFLFLRGLQYNGSHVFVKDQERVQVFTNKFDFVGSLISTDITHRRFSVSPNFMFLQCQRSDWLVCARSTLPPYEWVQSIKLLPVLDLPDRSGENANEVTVSPRGDFIAVTYKSLPYIFVYDDHFTHVRTIRFEGGDVRTFEPVGLPSGASAKEFKEPGSFSFIATIKFINSHYLIVRAPTTDNYVLDLSGNDYKIVRKIIFHPPNETKGISATDFLLHQDQLYVSSMWEEYVYGYDFNLD